MDDHKLDQFFRDRLLHSDKSPSGAEWEAMRAMLHEDKRRKPVFWWIAGSSIVFILVALVFTWHHSDVDDESIEPGQSEKQKTEKVEKKSTDSYTLEGEKTIHEKNAEFSTQNSSNSIEEKTSKAVAIVPNTDQVHDVPVTLVADQNRDVVKVIDTDSLQPASQDHADQPAWMRQAEQTECIPSLAMYIVDEPGRLLPLPYREEKLFTTPKKLPLRYAWSGMLMINPTPEQSPLQGMQLGFNVEKPINDHWYVGASPSFHMRVNEQGFSKFESFTSFGFSAREETYGLQANSLQFLRTPIYLGRSFQRHHMELGLAIDLLLGARGTLREVAVVDQEVQIVESLNSGWIETGDMKNVSAELFLGYKYQVNPYLKTGVSVFINPGKLYPGLPDNRGQLYRKWYMGMQVIYYVK